MTDTERLDWLEKNSDGGGIFNDDAWAGPLRWAFSASGFSPVVDSEPLEGQWVFWVEKDDWKPTIREAIDHAAALHTDDSSEGRAPAAQQESSGRNDT